MVSFCTVVFYNPICERVTLGLSLLLCGSILKKKVKAVCGSYSTAALRHIVLLPE